MIMNDSPPFISRITYPIKSLLLFVCFQLLLLPITILVDGLGIRAISNTLYYVVSVQSFFTTTLFSYLVYGKRYPANIWTWFLVGIFVHVIGGIVLGYLLRNRFVRIRQTVRLLCSLVFFEIILTMFMVYVVKSAVWLDVWHLPSGW